MKSDECRLQVTRTRRTGVLVELANFMYIAMYEERILTWANVSQPFHTYTRGRSGSIFSKYLRRKGVGIIWYKHYQNSNYRIQCNIWPRRWITQQSAISAYGDCQCKTRVMKVLLYACTFSRENVQTALGTTGCAELTSAFLSKIFRFESDLFRCCEDDANSRSSKDKCDSGPGDGLIALSGSQIQHWRFWSRSGIVVI